VNLHFIPIRQSGAGFESPVSLGLKTVF